MKTITIKTQAEFDALPKKFDEFTFIEIRSDPSLEIIVRETYGSSQVTAYGSSQVRACGSSQVTAYGSSQVRACGSSQVRACGSSQVTAYGSSQVTAYGSSQVRACDSSQVRAYDSSQVTAYDSVSVHAHSVYSSIELFGFTAVWLLAKAKVKAHSKTVRIITPKRKEGVSGWLSDHGVKATGGKVVLFKRVSKDLKTQENTPNETTWTIGETLTVPGWDPKGAECGPGKFHGCAAPHFCDTFRDNRGDRYVAVEVATKDLHVWAKPEYPHKIAFRAGRVLHECDWMGNAKKVTT